MNNQFLQHLKSITPQGKAEEKKIFIPASEFKDKKADRVEVQSDEEQLDEATRSKYLKAYAKHKVGTDTGKLELARMKRSAAMLRRGGADDETMRAGVADKGDMNTYNRVAMAKYRFANKAARSEEDGKKSPRKSTNEAVSTNDPNRGRIGRAKPKLPPGLDPYDMYSKGEIRPYGGKLQKRIASMSSEDRKRYYREIGIRSRAASRGGKTQRLFPMTEGVERIFEAKKPMKKLKRVLKRVKRAVKGAYNILSTPQDNADYMMTGRKF